MAGDALRSNITTLGSLMLLMSKQLRFLVAYCSVVLPRSHEGEAPRAGLQASAKALLHSCKRRTTCLMSWSVALVLAPSTGKGKLVKTK